MILGKQHDVCRLCLRKQKLCESHIVPEFCYEYEQVGNARKAIEAILPSDGNVKRRTIQKGHREYLFCEKCEQILCSHEREFASFWQNNPQLAGPFEHEQRVVVKGIDYHHTKLFLLSVIWRASLSEILGSNISLGPYSEKLRKIILDDEHVPQNAYPVLGRLILDNDGRPFRGFVADPLCIRHGQVRRYSICFAGCEWNFFMSDHGVPKPFDDLQHAIAENGELYLIAMHHGTIPAIKQIVERLRQNDR